MTRESKRVLRFQDLWARCEINVFESLEKLKLGLNHVDNYLEHKNQADR
jgi:hypothetical protein